MGQVASAMAKPPEPSGPQGPQNANKNAMKPVATPEIKAEYDRLSKAFNESPNTNVNKAELKAKMVEMEQKYSGLTASGGRSRKRKRKRRKSVRR